MRAFLITYAVLGFINTATVALHLLIEKDFSPVSVHHRLFDAGLTACGFVWALCLLFG